MRWTSFGTYLVAVGCAFGVGWGAAKYWPGQGAPRRAPTVAPMRPQWAREELSQRPSVEEIIAEIQEASKNGVFTMSRRWETLIRALEAKEMPALIVAVEALPEGSARVVLRSTLYRRWGELDPEAALARALSGDRPSLREQTVNIIVNGWAQANPDGLWAWARVQPAGADRDTAITAYLNQLVGSDPAGALAVMKWWGPPERANYMFSQTFTALAARDRAAALKEAASLEGISRTNAFRGIATGWAAQDPRGALEWVEGLPTADRLQLKQAVLGSWAQSDPVAAAAYYSALPAAERNNGPIGTIASRWADLDLPAAVAWAKGLPDINAQRNALQGLMNRWTENPKDGLAELSTLGPPLRNEMTNQFFSNWTRREPAAALAYLRDLPASDERDTGMMAMMNSMQDPKAAMALLTELGSASKRFDQSMNLASRLARTDPDAALEYARSMPTEFEQLRMIQQLTQNLSYEFPDRAAELAALLPQGQQRNNALAQIAGNLANRDIAAALKFMDDVALEGPARNQAMQQLAMRMIDIDPARALAMIEEMPTGQQRDSALGNYVGRLAQRNIADAIKYAAEMPPGRSRDNAQQQIVSQLSQSDPQKAAEYVQALPPGQAQSNAASQVVNNWANKNPDAALAWASTLEGNMRDNAMRGLLSSVANWSPAKAVAMLDTMTFSANQIETAYTAIVGPWAQSDPRGAVAWAANLPPAQRERTLNQAIQSWTSSEPQVAAAWVQQIPDPATRDRSINAMVGSYSFQNPALAASWAESISDQKLRDQASENIARNWLNQDQAAATAWLSGSTLPEARKQALLRSAAAR